MPYKLRYQIPSIKATAIEIADYIEVECLKKRNLKISFLEIVKSFDVADDYQENDLDENNSLRDNQGEVNIINAFSELEKRKIYCNGNYPFYIDNHLVEVKNDNPLGNIVYIYLLLATRLIMGGQMLNENLMASTGHFCLRNFVR